MKLFLLIAGILVLLDTPAVAELNAASAGWLRSEVFGLRSRESEGLCGIVLRELVFSE